MPATRMLPSVKSRLLLPDIGQPGRAAAAWRTAARSWPARLLIGGGVIKGVVYAARALGASITGWLDSVNTVGNVALLAGGGYLLFRLLRRARRHLLWRVRRKLIVSYIFIGVVPVLLIVAFFVFAGIIVFLNIGSFLVRDSLDDVIEQARFVAETVIAESGSTFAPDRVAPVMAEWVAKTAARYPGASIAVVPVSADPRGTERPVPGGIGPASPPPARLTAGEWGHLAAPESVPTWVSRAGFTGLLGLSKVPGGSPPSLDEDAFLVVRTVGLAGASPRRYAVVVDIPVRDTLLQRIRETTSVKVTSVTLLAETGDSAPAQQQAPRASSPEPSGEPEISGKRRIKWMALFETVDWPTGATRRALVTIEVNISDIYEKLSAAQARFGTYSFGRVALFFLLLLAVLFFIIEVAALIMGLVLARSITGAVHALFTGTERVIAGNLDHRIAVTSGDQLGELAASFNEMTVSVKGLLREAEEKKRLEEELRIARAIQMSLLPQGELSVPGLSITAICRPAREVGGDYYDLFHLDDGLVALLIADVSGKGTSAALYMAELKGLILSLSQIHRSPRQLLIHANRIISEHLDSRSFITMTYAVIDASAGTMSYARAGHTPLIFYRPNQAGDAEATILVPDGLVLGLRLDGGRLFESLLDEATLDLRLGDMLVFFTDGISEAMNQAEDCFGEIRLCQVVKQHAHLGSEQLCDRILREVEAFVGDASQHDDMTMILVRVGEDAPVAALVGG